MSTRHALVTGAAGFIGAALTRRLLADGFEVTLPIRPGTELWRLDELGDAAEILDIDLRDAAAVDAAFDRVKPELVFHLAAHGAYSWQTSLPRMIETNVGATANVVEAAVRTGVRALVNAGSSSEYGFVDHAPLESDLPEPNSSYAVTKAAATLYCGSIARTRQQAITTLRLYSAYGPWEEPRRLIPALVLEAMDGTLPPLADPAVARDFVYVDDIVDAFVTAAHRARPGEGAVYNIGSGRQTTLRELVDVARDVFDVTVEPAWGSFPERHWDTSIWVADPRRARDELGWTARCSLAEGLAATGAWLGSSPRLLPRYRGSETAPAA